MLLSMLSDFRVPLKVWTSFASDNAGELVNNLLKAERLIFIISKNLRSLRVKRVFWQAANR